MPTILYKKTGDKVMYNVMNEELDLDDLAYVLETKIPETAEAKKECYRRENTFTKEK